MQPEGSNGEAFTFGSESSDFEKRIHMPFIRGRIPGSK